MLSIEEKQAFYMFNEVSKAEGLKDLCLPVILKMRVESESGKKASGLSSMLSRIESGASRSHSIFDEAHVVDYKIMTHSHDHGLAHGVTVPFNVQHVMASVLLTQLPVDTETLRLNAVTLAFKIDGNVRLRFFPDNISLKR
mmetsp:Transcript_10145/g.13776  ORF Transcript_10145/g.13776 Transcript_10145/m.13776 type:complete len:141 (+) Transcript_10145:2746-3168(+)